MELMELLAYAASAMKHKGCNTLINEHLSVDRDAGPAFTTLWGLLKPHQNGVGSPPSAEEGMQMIQRLLAEPGARAVLEQNLGAGGLRAATLVCGSVMAQLTRRPLPGVDEPAFGGGGMMVMAQPAVYPSGMRVMNNPGGMVRLDTITPPAATAPAPVVAPPAPVPVVAHPTLPSPVGWGRSPTPSGYPQAPVAGYPAPAPTPVPVAFPPPPSVAAAVPVVQPPPAPALSPALAAPTPAAVPAPEPPPMPKTPWEEHRMGVADYTYAVVTALMHLLQFQQLHKSWSKAAWESVHYGLEWGWVRLTTTREIEAVVLRLPQDKVPDAVLQTLSGECRPLHRLPGIGAVKEFLGTLGEYPEIARSLQLEHYARLFATAEDLARDLGQVHPAAYLVMANTIRLGGTLAVMRSVLPDGEVPRVFPWGTWIEAHGTILGAAGGSSKSLAAIREIAVGNPMLDMATGVEVVDDLGAHHTVTDRTLFAPTGVLKGGRQDDAR